MNVLQVYKTRFPHSEGGVDVVVSNLLRHGGSEVNAVLLRTAEWSSRGLRSEVIEGVRVYSLHLPLPPSGRHQIKSWLFFLASAPVALLRLQRLLRAAAIDLVHLHTLQVYHLYFVILRIMGGPPFVLTLHRAEVLAYSQCNGLRRWSWRQVLRRAAAVTAVSNWLAGVAAQTFSFVSSIHVIENGIDIPASLPAGPPLRARLGLPSRYFIMIGTCKPYKGHEVALRAWAELRADFSDIGLVIVGSGELLPTYQALVAELAISKRVYMTGQLERADALALARDSIAMLMPSRSEGLAISLLEAGVVGVPVICSDIGSFRAVIDPDISGLMFPVDDALALKHMIERLAADAALRTMLAVELARRARTTYAVGDMTKNYAALYANVLDNVAVATDLETAKLPGGRQS